MWVECPGNHKIDANKLIIQYSTAVIDQKIINGRYPTQIVQAYCACSIKRGGGAVSTTS